jgi:putative transcription antitermination factor YqgF
LPHGIQLNCRHSGQPARPVLLFLHGFPEGAFAWDELLDHFSQPQNGGYFCVAPNLRGFETSSTPADPAAYRAKFFVQDILALIDIVSPGQALAALVAHDWGGAVAWTLANQHPERLQRLVIIKSPHPGTFLRDLQSNPGQQAASAYMNFLIRPDAAALLALADKYDVAAFVLGLPLNMDGSEGPRVQATRAFARNLATLSPLPIHYWDERLSTAAVTRTLLAADASRARRAELVDKMAAAYILQGILDLMATQKRQSLSQEQQFGFAPLTDTYDA